MSFSENMVNLPWRRFTEQPIYRDSEAEAGSQEAGSPASGKDYGDILTLFARDKKEVYITKEGAKVLPRYLF